MIIYHAQFLYCTYLHTYELVCPPLPFRTLILTYNFFFSERLIAALHGFSIEFLLYFIKYLVLHNEGQQRFAYLHRLRCSVLIVAKKLLYLPPNFVNSGTGVILQVSTYCGQNLRYRTLAIYLCFLMLANFFYSLHGRQVGTGAVSIFCFPLKLSKWFIGWQLTHTKDHVLELKKQGSGSGRIRTFLVGSGAGSGKFSPDPDPIGTLAM